MKKTILSMMMLTVLFTTSGFAKEKRPTTTKSFTTKTVAAPKKFSTLVLYDVDIILTNDANTGVRVEGEKKAVDGVEFMTNFDQLTVLGKAKDARKDRVKVYVPASMLSKIEMYGTSHVTSSEQISNSGMDVFVDCRCKLDVKSTGTVNVKTDDKCEYASSGKTTVAFDNQ